MARGALFTSESVSMGHPDKMCDQISDAVLDAMLAQDPASRVACETLTTTGLVMLAGEVTTRARVDLAPLVREVVTEIGYTSSEMGFDAATCGVIIALGRQSPGAARSGHPPLLYLEPRHFLARIVEHYLFAALHEIFYGSLMAENRQRLQHMDYAVRRIEEMFHLLTLKRNSLRQEEITEEIEVIMLSVGVPR